MTTPSDTNPETVPSTFPGEPTVAKPKSKSPATQKRTRSISKKEVMPTQATKVRRPFPQNPFDAALSVPLAVKDKNNGKPLEPEEVARAFRIAVTNTKFFYLAASSRDYGLTTGSRDTDFISLTELGTTIAYPESAEQQRLDKIKAFMNVALFKDVFEHYGGGSLPEKEFVSSVLFKKFGLDSSLHDEFCEIYLENCKYLSIVDGQTALQPVKRDQQGFDQPVVVVGQPGKYTHHAFVIMPFSEKGQDARPKGFFDEVLSSMITPACNAADFGVQTARSHGSDLIHHTIIRQLVEADLVVADLTDHNPNVLFELGIRIALDKPILLIRAKGTPAIFDVDHMMRVCEYDPRLWKTTIVADITTMTDHVKGSWENKGKNPSYMGILKTGQSPTFVTATVATKV